MQFSIIISNYKKFAACHSFYFVGYWKPPVGAIFNPTAVAKSPRGQILSPTCSWVNLKEWNHRSQNHPHCTRPVTWSNPDRPLIFYRGRVNHYASMRRDDLRRFYTELFIPHRKMKIKTRLSTFATLSQKMHEYRHPPISRLFEFLRPPVARNFWKFGCRSYFLCSSKWQAAIFLKLNKCVTLRCHISVQGKLSNFKNGCWPFWRA